MKSLFDVNAAPIKTAQYVASPPLTRESLLAAAKACADAEERARNMPQPRRYYVSPAEFEEYVACGLIDREGNFL